MTPDSVIILDAFGGAGARHYARTLDRGAFYIGQTVDDTLVGRDGRDFLEGFAGNDILIGAAGDDVLLFDAADQLRVDGGTGRDALRFSGGADLDFIKFESLRNFDGKPGFSLGQGQ